MTGSPLPMVIIHITAGGDFDVLACGDLRLVWIDDNATTPEAKVFEQLERVPASKIIQLLGGDRVQTSLEPKPGKQPPHLRLVRDGEYELTGPDTLTAEWVHKVCRPGEGARCCRYLLLDENGFCCERHTELTLPIDKGVADGAFSSMGINCQGVKP